VDEVIWSGAAELQEHLLPIGDLKPFPGNARRGDVPRIAQSLRRFGQVRAVLIYDDRTIVAGHHVVKAATTLGWTHVAAIPAEFGSRDDARDYLVADNQLATLGHVEPAAQMTLLDAIEQSGSFEGTGFTADDLADARALSTHKTEMVEARTLKAHERNYRDHPADQVEHLIKSLREHGIYQNVVVARDGTILAGHGIYEAARRIGLNKIPVTRLDLDPNDPQALKIVAGDNEIGKLGEVDDRALTELLKEARDGDVGALLGTGYDAQTLANLVLVTRPESEIRDHDAAAEWVGLPEFEPIGARISLVLAFDSEEEREALVDQLGLFLAKKTRGTWSAHWPPRPQEDLSSLRFEG
jgi:ParB-like chromosome segregation protein Spo0J